MLMMTAGPLIVQLIAAFILTISLLNKYGNFYKQHYIVTISAFIAWFFSFTIIFVLPLDIAITFYNRCLLEKKRLEIAHVGNNTFDCHEPFGYVPNDILLNMWRIVYWTAQCLTWIVLPLIQSYSNAGDFTSAGKIRSAINNNAIYYGTYLIVFLFLLLYAVGKGVALNAEHLKVILISASNTWGLFILVILLGFGLVEVPRQFWQMSNKNYRLRKTYFDIDKMAADKNDAEDTLKEVYREARSVLTLLQNKHGLRDYAQIIVAKFPPDVVGEINARFTGNFSAASCINPEEEVYVESEKYLIRLHKRVIRAVCNHHRVQAQWKALTNRAFYLEEVYEAEITGAFMRQTASESLIYNMIEKLEFVWNVKVKRILLQIAGFIFFGMTMLIMWSECTFFIVHPRLSLAARIVHSSALGYHYFRIQLYSIVLISYLCICAYYTVFKLRIYRYYHLDPHHMTDENSLLFCAILLCRLTPPICLNFLGMIHLDSHITSDTKFGVETQFTKLMGHLDVIPILAKGINIYLPIVMVLLSLGTWFRLRTRFLHFIGVEQFVGDDDLTAELIKSGKALVTLERRKLNRALDRERRGKYCECSGQRKQNASSKPDDLNDVDMRDQLQFSGFRPYDDVEGIMRADDRFAFSESDRSGHQQNVGSGFSSTHPPTNMFDDL